jgi:hypothetical protein
MYTVYTYMHVMHIFTEGDHSLFNATGIMSFIHRRSIITAHFQIFISA